MNIKHLKEELERLNLIIANWDDNQEVDAIEQDMALDHLKSLYNEIRFSPSQSKSEIAEPEQIAMPTPIPEEPTEVANEEEAEQEVEVEFIFNEEDFEFPQEADEQSLEEQSLEEQSEEVAEEEIPVENNVDDEDNFFDNDSTSAQ